MKTVQIRYAGITGLVTVLVFIAACGGTTSSSTAGGSPPTPTPSFTPTAAPATASPTTAPAPPTATVTATPTPTQASSSVPDEVSDEETLAQGKLIFEKTAGGVGCAMCHGMNGQGDPMQGAPPNIGASAEMIEQALFDRPQMSFIKLTRDEVNAVAAYLQWLKEQQ